jgi:hypothetical protein
MTRQKFLLTNHCVTIHYPLENCSEKLPRIPKEFKLQYTDYKLHYVFVKSNQLLVVLGLLNTSIQTEGVAIFDILSRKWRLGNDMPCSRTYFACAALSAEWTRLCYWRHSHKTVEILLRSLGLQCGGKYVGVPSSHEL